MHNIGFGDLLAGLEQQRLKMHQRSSLASTPRGLDYPETGIINAVYMLQWTNQGQHLGALVYIFVEVVGSIWHPKSCMSHHLMTCQHIAFDNFSKHINENSKQNPTYVQWSTTACQMVRLYHSIEDTNTFWIHFTCVINDQHSKWQWKSVQAKVAQQTRKAMQHISFYFGKSKIIYEGNPHKLIALS